MTPARAPAGSGGSAPLMRTDPQFSHMYPAPSLSLSSSLPGFLSYLPPPRPKKLQTVYQSLAVEVQTALLERARHRHPRPHLRRSSNCLVLIPARGHTPVRILPSSAQTRISSSPRRSSTWITNTRSLGNALSFSSNSGSDHQPRHTHHSQIRPC